MDKQLHRFWTALGFSYTYDLRVIGEPIKNGDDTYEYEVELLDKYLSLFGYRLFKVGKTTKKKTGRYNIQ